MTKEQLENLLERFQYPLNSLKIKRGIYFYEFENLADANEMMDLFQDEKDLEMELVVDDITPVVLLKISNQEENEFILL